MSNNRREFLKLTGLAGIGLAGAGILNSCAGSTAGVSSNPDQTKKLATSSHRQHFNMSGYAAPKIDKVRIGFIGLGMRGPAAVIRMNYIDGVEIKALCDLRPEKVAAVQKSLVNSGHQPATYSGKADAWKALCEREDIDLVYIATPWHLHTPMALYALEHGKHVAVEVPAARTLEECWQLVETSERTQKHCMM
ncbi:MAG: acetylgalactosaminidase, partial [Cytophagales bacterium CG18_big_fil_WC_8_21_14_2_50_42_9]